MTTNNRCTYVLAGAGSAYPRTCAECGLGPCKLGHNTGTFAERVKLATNTDAAKAEPMQGLADYLRQLSVSFDKTDEAKERFRRWADDVNRAQRAAPVAPPPVGDGVPTNAQLSEYIDAHSHLGSMEDMLRGAITQFAPQVDRAGAPSAPVALAAGQVQPSQAALPAGLVKDILIASDLLHERWKAQSKAVSRRLSDHASALMHAATPAPAQVVPTDKGGAA